MSLFVNEICTNCIHNGILASYWYVSDFLKRTYSFYVEAIELAVIGPKLSKLILVLPISVPRIVCIIIVVHVSVRL